MNMNLITLCFPCLVVQLDLTSRPERKAPMELVDSSRS